MARHTGKQSTKTTTKNKCQKRERPKTPHVQIRGTQKTDGIETTWRVRIPLSPCNKKRKARNTKRRELVGREAPMQQQHRSQRSTSSNSEQRPPPPGSEKQTDGKRQT